MVQNQAVLQSQSMQPGARVLISAMVWSAGEPQLRLRCDGKASELVDATGIELVYAHPSAGPMRRCVGHKPFREPTTPWVDCDTPPLAGARTCDRCTAIDATFASQLHHAHNLGTGEIDTAVRAHLEKPNVAYLAGFRDGSIKIGTSTAPRLETRLLEQGAWLATTVALATNGFAVRMLEDLITSELGLPQSVTVTRKLRGLTDPRPDDSLVTKLAQWTQGVHRLIGELNDDRLNAANTEWMNPNASDESWSRVHPYPQRLDRGAHAFVIEKACGRSILLRRPGGTDSFVADIGQLFGVECTIGDDVVPDELTVQDSLF